MPCVKRIAMLGMIVALAGCSGVADTLGLGRNAPDEFAVVDRPPLSLPPDFELRPPRPGAPRPQEVKTEERASQMLFGTKSGASRSSGADGASDGEKALLQTAGAAKADPGIRETIDRETTQKVVGSKRLIDDVLWWRDQTSSGTTVDAAAEAERLREAKEKGEAPTATPTPIIEKDKSGWLGL